MIARTISAGGNRFHTALQLEHMKPHQLAQQRFLVRKILIERTDADAGLFRHAIGGKARVPILDQNASSSVENDIDGRA